VLAGLGFRGWRHSKEFKMKRKSSIPGAPAPWEVSGDRALELFWLYRQQLRAHSDVTGTTPQKKARSATPAGKALAAEDLPEELQRMVRHYERDHPGIRLEPLRYLTVGSPGEAKSSLAIEGLPSDNELIFLSVTETISVLERIAVRSLVLIAARHQPIT
jgi:hypothetical protein